MKSFINKFFLISLFPFFVFSIFASPNLDVDIDGNTVLHKAAKELDVEKVRSILEEYKRESSEDEFKIFVNRINFKDKGRTALHYLAELAIKEEGFVHPDDMEEFDKEDAAEKGEYEEYPNTDDLKTILEIIKLLIENCANLFILDKSGICPIDYFRVKNIYNYNGSEKFEEIRELLSGEYTFFAVVSYLTSGCTIS